LTTAERLVGIVPSLALFTYFFSGVAVYAIVRRGIPADREISARPPSVFLGSFLAQYYAWVLGPFERALVRLRLSPDALTWIGLGMSGLAGVAFALGAFSTGGWLYLGTGTLDILDGRIARRTGRTSRGGALFDSVVDRYAEYFVFAGLLIYYRDRLGLMLTTLLALLGSFMVSYVRARGAGLGVDAKTGSMQRPERILYLGVSAAASPVIVAVVSPGDPHPPHHLTAAVLALLAVTANGTAIRRFAAIRRGLRASTPGE
jgi:phosphatidylglycerophosphate synthase